MKWDLSKKISAGRKTKYVRKEGGEDLDEDKGENVRRERRERKGRKNTNKEEKRLGKKKVKERRHRPLSMPENGFDKE